uniref:Uncharacterized protein n=1 Tax=Cacopsylla melanoneura TaxID=428564 RepID=A0A8D8S6P5_9HEMI
MNSSPISLICVVTIRINSSPISLICVVTIRMNSSPISLICVVTIRINSSPCVFFFFSRVSVCVGLINGFHSYIFIKTLFFIVPTVYPWSVIQACSGNCMMK